MKTYKISFLLSTLFLIGALYHCQSTSEHKIVVGFSMNSLKDPFLLSLKQGAEEAANRHDVKLIVTESQANLAKQINAVEDLLQRGVDILGVNPVDAKGIVSVIEAANKAGVPVITVDTDAYGGEVTTFVGSNNVQGGRLAAEYIIHELKGKGKIVILDDVPGKAAIMERIKGFKDALQNESGMEIISIQPAYGRRDMAITVTENIIQAHQQIDAIFAVCDAMALGALDVLESLGKKQDVVLVGFDACPEAIQAIKGNRLDADIAQFPQKMGRAFIEAAVKIAKGEKLPKYLPIPVVCVTKDNIESFNLD